MHWLLQKLNSYGNKTAVIDDSEISYAELVAKVQKHVAQPYIQVSSGLFAVLEILSGLENKQVVCFKYMNTDQLPDVRPLLVLETSGTTGKPKQVLHDFNLFVEKYRNRVKPINTVLTYPLNHIAGIDVMLSVLASGGTLILTYDNQKSIAESIQKYRPEYLACTPTFLRLMLLSGILEQYDLSSLKQISYGAEKMSPELLKILIQRLPEVTFRQTYGTSETGVLKMHSDNTTWLKPNSAVTLKGEELGLKLPDSFLGYTEEEANISNGYIYLGDTFKLKGDEVQIAGRKSLMVNVGGQKVNPAEVEEVLYKKNGVNWCKVYGEENALLGNIVVADVYGNLDVKEVREHCRQHLEDYKVPQKINMMDSILPYFDVSVPKEYKDINILNLMPVCLPNSQIWLYNSMIHVPYTLQFVSSPKYVPNKFNNGAFITLRPKFQKLAYSISLRLGNWLLINYIKRFVKRKDRVNFDIIHAHFAHIGWQFRELAEFAPLAVSFYGFDYEKLPFIEPKWKGRYRELFNVASVIICEGENGKNILMKMGCPEGKIKVTPLGMVGDDIPHEIRTKSKDELRLIQVAPFRYKKGQIYTIKAFVEALKKAPNMHLTFIGDDVEGSLKEVEDIIKNEGIQDKVTIKPGIPYSHLHEHFEHEDVFIHPSCYTDDMDCEGGAPMVLIDAQMTGLPIISTTHCDIPNLVLEGKTGFLSSEKDIVGLRDSILKFYKMSCDDYEEMSYNACTYSRNNFSAEDCGIKLREIYQTLLT